MATISTGAIWRGARASVPLGVASGVLGAGFGVAAQHAGLPLWATAAMSASVFAGAAQFAVLPLWTAPLPMLPIWLSTFALNARFMLLTASLSTWFLRVGWRRAWTSVALMGEGPWAVATRAHSAGERDLGVFVGSGLVVWTVWLAGTAAGFVASPYLGDPRRLGLDLVLVLFFAATLTSAWRGPRDLVPWVAAAAATMIPTSIVAPQWQILVASLVGAAAGAWRDARP